MSMRIILLAFLAFVMPYEAWASKLFLAHGVGGVGTSIAFTTLANGTIGGSPIAGSGTYVGTAPSSISSATWGGTGCSGSSTVTSFSAGSGTWSANFSVPGSGAGGSTCNIAIADNLGDSATSPNVTVSGSSIWTLVAHTQLIPSGTMGGTTAAINCTGANLIVIGAAWYNGGQPITVSDSSSNSYTLAGGGGGLFTVEFDLYYKISPTVTSSMTFTVSSAGNTYGAVSVECWHDTSGTPTVQGTLSNQLSSSATSINISTVPFTPSANNSLLVAGYSANTLGASTPSIDSGFITPLRDVLPANSGINVQGGMTYLVQSTAASIDPTMTFGITASQSASSVIRFSP